jgi:prefoldin subunit 5
MAENDGVVDKVRERLRSARPGEIRELRARVRRLEAEVQECRALNARLAELTDIVTELLVPMAARDEDKLAELLERYRASV